MSAWTDTVAALSAAHIPHLLIGGLALGAHGYSRATRDADLLAPRSALEEPVWTARVADAADLVLLKLYAGGRRDLEDVRALLALDEGLAAEVAERLPAAPRECRRAWIAVNAGA